MAEGKRYTLAVCEDKEVGDDITQPVFSTLDIE
jgi:hypothetical protein